MARILLNNVQYIKKLVMVSACLFMLEQIPIKLETREGDVKAPDSVDGRAVLSTTTTTEKPSKLILVNVPLAYPITFLVGFGAGSEN